MKSKNIPSLFDGFSVREMVRTGGSMGVAALLLATCAVAQSTVAPRQTTEFGYTVQQVFDLGGHIVSYSGSGPMYDTLINLQSGPRILKQSMQMNAVPGSKHLLFDKLFTANTGYGGDPDNFTILRMSKGKLYDFTGQFRRDREYFDYDLLDNPLIPAGVTSNGYTFPQVEQAAHLFNTVRRMTDTNITFLPVSKVSFRAGYAQNINQGPSFTSMHNGSEGQFLQNWRNSTDSWIGAIDWKPLPRTMLTFQEYVTHYKGDTTQQLTGLNFQLPNGTPVSLGYDQVSAPTCTGGPAIQDSTTNPPTINPTCPAWLQFSRSAPTRTLIPTEEFRFQSSSIRNIAMNGRIRYTGATSNVPNFDESFLGQDNQGLRSWLITGTAKTKRVSVSGDYGLVWQISKKFSLSEQYDFWNYRQPGDSNLSEIDQLGTTMALPPGPPQPPSITTAHTFLGDKTETNKTTLAWKASPRATFSLGYHYRAETIGWEMPLSTDALPNGTDYTLVIHTNGGMFGVVLRPTDQWKVDGSIEVAYADNAYVQLDPRQLQDYQLHTEWTPKPWATLTGAFEDVERHDNAALVNHQDHTRNLGLAAQLNPNEHYGLELNYGYVDVFTQTGICYASTPAPAGAVAAPADCGTNTVLGNAYDDEPTQFGSFGIMMSPIARLHSDVGYRITAINGTAAFLNPRQVPGTLQSNYQSPYADAVWTLGPGWSVRGDWNYYSYAEGGAVGPTLPRDFRGNVVTLGIHYEF
jgi:hypothetical protein